MITLCIHHLTIRLLQRAWYEDTLEYPSKMSSATKYNCQCVDKHKTVSWFSYFWVWFKRPQGTFKSLNSLSERPSSSKWLYLLKLGKLYPPEIVAIFCKSSQELTFPAQVSVTFPAETSRYFCGSNFLLSRVLSLNHPGTFSSKIENLFKAIF